MPKINYSFGSGFGFTSTRSNAKQGVQRVLQFFPVGKFFVQVKVIVIYDSIIKELLNSPP
jgi:hypothetical protein